MNKNLTSLLKVYRDSGKPLVFAQTFLKVSLESGLTTLTDLKGAHLTDLKGAHLTDLTVRFIPMGPEDELTPRSTLRMPCLT